MFNFFNFPTLKTERLLLKKVTFKDAQAIYDLRSSEEINKFVNTKRVQNLEEAKDFITVCIELYKEQKRIFWVIEFDNQIIGTIVLHKISLQNKYAEIGYKLNLDFQKKGFMSEAIKAILDFGFKKMNLKTIEAFTHKNNLPSITLLEKNNFILQKERRDKSFEENRIFKLKRS